MPIGLQQKSQHFTYHYINTETFPVLVAVSLLMAEKPFAGFVLWQSLSISLLFILSPKSGKSRVFSKVEQGSRDRFPPYSCVSVCVCAQSCPTFETP